MSIYQGKELLCTVKRSATHYKPAVQIKNRGRILYDAISISKDISVNINVPQNPYSWYYPNEHRFKVTGFQISVIDSSHKIIQTKQFYSEFVPVYDLLSKAKPGMTFEIKILKIIRADFQGKLSNVEVPRETFCLVIIE